jgi:glycosyltransferase involved in cell wall biosynthesis
MKSKFKGQINVIVKYFYPVAAGIETNIMETYSVLAKQGWKVTIHTSMDTLTEKSILPSRETIRGLDIKRYPYKWWGYFPDLDWNTPQLICLHNFNLLPHFPIMLYTFLKKIQGKKYYGLIVTPHGGFNPEWSIFPRHIALFKRLLHYTLGTVLINISVDKIRAVSEWEKREIISKGVHPQKVETISNGIENEAYLDVDKLASPQVKQLVGQLGRYIIQIGRIYMIKNYETTIKALPRLPSDVKYVIAGPVGDEKYFSELKKTISELNLEKRVMFIGVIRGVDKYYLIKHAYLMVHMALWESFCNVVHEGLSQGLVCIVGNNTALPLLIKDNINGYLVETRDSSKLSEKINFVLNNYSTRNIQYMQNRNRVFGLRDSWEHVSQRMDRLYNRAIRNYYETKNNYL